MAGHLTSYTKIQNLNIRHIYSERPFYIGPKTWQFQNNGILYHDRRVAMPKRLPKFELRFQERCLEYLPDYSFKIPKAPAFRLMDRENVDEIVERLTRPKSTSCAERLLAKREQENCEYRTSSAKSERVPLDEEFTSRKCKSAPPKRTKKDIDEIVNRLNQPHRIHSRESKIYSKHFRE